MTLAAHRVVGYIHAPTAPGHFPLDAQKGAILDYCEKRGWELTEILDFSSSSDVAISTSAIKQHLADHHSDVLIVASVYLLEFVDALERSFAEGWSLVATNESLDTTTSYGQMYAKQLLHAPQRMTPPPCPWPLPSADLIYRVAGHRSAVDFDNSGSFHLDALQAILQQQGKSFADFPRILDFGCGCGRFLRRLPHFAPNSSFLGVDIDQAAIEWTTEHLAFAKVSTINPLPPVDLPDNCADLAIAFSVFTHLDEHYQDAWLEELARLLAPGGIGLFTVHGDLIWHRDSTASLVGSPNLPELTTQLNEHGIAYWSQDGWGEFFPDFYHTTYHATRYVKSHWSKWFDVLAVVPGSFEISHDVVVVRARAKSSTSNSRRRFSLRALIKNR